MHSKISDQNLLLRSIVKSSNLKILNAIIIIKIKYFRIILQQPIKKQFKIIQHQEKILKIQTQNFE